MARACSGSSPTCPAGVSFPSSSRSRKAAPGLASSAVTVERASATASAWSSEPVMRWQVSKSRRWARSAWFSASSARVARHFCAATWSASAETGFTR